MKEPKCFMSYSWDSDEHKDWVRTLGTALTENGVLVYLDQWDVRPGLDLPQYMETAIRNSDFVFLVCTTQFAKKANLGRGGVGYEKSIVTGEVFDGSASKTKYVPVLREGTKQDSLPSYIKSRTFVDFRNNDRFTENLEKLLRHVYDQPKFKRPSIGSPPPFIRGSGQSDSVSASILEAPTSSFNLDHYRKLYEFALSWQHMSLSQSEARQWADQHMSILSPERFELFKKAFTFALDRVGGLSKENIVAADWAISILRKISEIQLEEIVTLFSYAKSYEGLGLSIDEAYKWSIEKLGFEE